MGTSTMRKVTFSLPTALLQELREVVAAGVFPSQNVLVRKAVERELKRARNEWLRKEFQEAARDPMFLRDLKETMAAYETADAETARMIVDA